ncbi:MAG TPA: glycoside hydrolase family 16 protein, partial [Candidatus Nitrosotalea sp.]|nr:glycoside hydrolase family 16 protein [Candidatus Nitrosotalea sp.]
MPFRIHYRFQAEGPLKTAFPVFVHYRDRTGKILGQGDHAPAVATDSAGWTGLISYEQTSTLPENTPDGTYDIVAGFWTAKEGRIPLTPGKGVRDLGDNAYVVGTVTIDRNAPRPKADTEGPKTLNLDGYRLVFNEEFDGPLDVSPGGPGTQWIAHTPWNGDFGDAAFANPDLAKGFPFKVEKGILRIEARKNSSGRWQAGLLASNDPRGRGFALQYGYFEMRAKLPPGRGIWPAFWLCSSWDRTNPKAGDNGSVEIDMLEYYGDETGGSFTSTVHVWKPEPHRAEGRQITTRPHELTEAFHN